MAVPENLRVALGKRELRTRLGPDKRAALRKLTIEIAKFLDVFAEARHASGIETPAPRRALSAVELAHLRYDETLERGEMARNFPREEGRASICIHEGPRACGRAVSLWRRADSRTRPPPQPCWRLSRVRRLHQAAQRAARV